MTKCEYGHQLDSKTGVCKEGHPEKIDQSKGLYRAIRCLCGKLIPFELWEDHYDPPDHIEVGQRFSE